LRADPDDFKTFAALTRLLIRKGDYATAEVRIYDGLKRFHDAARLQALMAQLQVCIHSYAAAVTFQTSALEIYRKAKKPGALKSDPDFADLHTNMGVIYFLWGTQQMEASRQTNGAKQRENLKTEAHKHFEQALNFYRAALAITPEDVYLLDEYARICFNLAELSTGAEREALWQQTIEALITVICFPGVGALGLESVRETNAFLAHAYTKSGQFEMARTLIGVMQSCQPDYWMVYYVKACHFSLRAAAGESDCIALALEALGRAVKVSSPQNNSRSLADADPDLAALREAEPAAFTDLLQVPVKAAFQ
jgi:tetratricopeptide (TPR) repeat protein